MYSFQNIYMQCAKVYLVLIDDQQELIENFSASSSNFMLVHYSVFCIIISIHIHTVTIFCIPRPGMVAEGIFRSL